MLSAAYARNFFRSVPTGLVALMFVTGPVSAKCYHKQGDMTETIRDGEEETLAWQHKSKRVVFQTATAGTGIEARVAYDPNMNGFRYEFVGMNLVFGDVIYVPGCRK